MSQGSVYYGWVLVGTLSLIGGGYEPVLWLLAVVSATGAVAVLLA